MRLAALPAALVAAALLAGCPSKHTTFTGQLKYGKTPEDNYNNGVDELKDGNDMEAVRFFEHVRLKFPFSKFATLSELRLADAKFEQERFLEAAEAYSGFVQLHPTHEEVDYAEFRAALSHLLQAPSDFVLFPPAYEKDQREVERAVELLENFVGTRSSSKYHAEAVKLLAEARGRLAAHEWYVAEFYWKRERWAGAAQRYDALVVKYPGSSFEPEALLKMAEAYLKLDEKYRARTALQRLIVKHPQDPHRPEAEKLLASIR
jgi:outer membrane protein assembly factor BamD